MWLKNTLEKKFKLYEAFWKPYCKHSFKAYCQNFIVEFQFK